MGDGPQVEDATYSSEEAEMIAAFEALDFNYEEQVRLSELKAKLADITIWYNQINFYNSY
jgi:hypothetical protein